MLFNAHAGIYALPLPEKLNSQGQWSVYRNVRSLHSLVSRFPPPDDNLVTVYDVWQSSINRHRSHNFLGWREAMPGGQWSPYKWMTFGEAGRLRDEITSAFVHLGMRPGDTVGLYAQNCAEWVLTDAACHAMSAISVPLYDTLGPDAVRYICGHAELSAIVCSAKVLPIVLQCVGDCPTLKAIIVFGAGASPSPPSPRAGLRILSWDDCLALGRSNPRPHVPPAPETVVTICYTSGTTGVPKGAVLTHANLLANAAGNYSYFPVGPGDVHVSYLPLAHIYERVNQITLIYRGVGIGFFTGDVQRLLDDIQALRPTVFCSVPRLLNRIHDKVMAAIDQGSAVSRTLFRTAYAHKSKALLEGRSLDTPLIRLYDRVVFSKVRERLGGRVKVMTTGASPISKEVFTFLRVCFPVVLEGYGMTESSCAISLTDPTDRSMGHVGAPIPCMEVKLVDIPEMSYLTTDKPLPRGEVCLRGPCIFQGYHKDPVQTRECLDEDGWLHTGDVGTWLSGGRLKIIDRKKNLFKLAQGEYIAPEKIEGVYCRSPLIMQVFVYGDSLRASLVAVVVPDPDTARDWSQRRGKGAMPLSALIKDPAFIADVATSMKEEARNAELRGFEVVASFTLVEDQFTVENGLLTPTFKLKRNDAKKMYQPLIDKMYAGLGKQ